MPKTQKQTSKNIEDAHRIEEDSIPFNFKNDVNWRIFRIMAEFVEGFQFLSELKNEVTFFGSARFNEQNKYYREAHKLAYMLGKAGYTVITGGGSGVMEAGNRGAYESGAESVGLNIQLPQEQRTNRFVKKGMGFNYFFTRKTMLSASAQAYIFFPGGFGTLDEFFEIITLIQTRKMEKVPVVLVGREFWGNLIQWIDGVVCDLNQTIAPEDKNIYTLVDCAKEAFELVKKSKERKYL